MADSLNQKWHMIRGISG